MEFGLYDVTNECRECGNGYASKSFLPPEKQSPERRFGFCPDCCEILEAKLRHVTQHTTKQYAKPKPKPAEQPRERRQYRWEPD